MHRMLSVACVLQSTKDCSANNVLMATLVAAPMVDLIQLVYPAIVITILTLVTLRLASASIAHTIPQVTEQPSLRAFTNVLTTDERVKHMQNLGLNQSVISIVSSVCPLSSP